MKLSKIILENNRIIHKAELNLSEKDIDNLSEAISKKLNEYLDLNNRDLLIKTVKAAIEELTV